MTAHFRPSVSETEAKRYSTDFLFEAALNCLHIAYERQDLGHRLLVVSFLKDAPRTEWNKAAQILGKSKLIDSVQVLA